MANFRPVRYSGTSTTPVSDGQMLVDKTTGLVSFDIGSSRIRPNNIYGVIAHVTADQWVSDNGSYILDTSTLDQSIVPSNYYIVGASVLSGSQYTISLSDQTVIIRSDSAIACAILLFCLPTAPSAVQDTVDVEDESGTSTYTITSGEGDTREWTMTSTEAVPTAISVSGDVLLMEDETATGGDRVWSI